MFVFGFQILLDSSSRGYWLNELAWILRNDCENALKTQCFETMLSALNNCHDIVQITDDENKLMFGNLASEKIFGYKGDDLKDRSLWELQTISGLAENSSTEKESVSNGNKMNCWSGIDCQGLLEKGREFLTTPYTFDTESDWGFSWYIMLLSANRRNKKGILSLWYVHFQWEYGEQCNFLLASQIICTLDATNLCSYFGMGWLNNSVDWEF